MLGFEAGGGRLGSRARKNRGGRESADPSALAGPYAPSPRLELEAVAAVTLGRGSEGRSSGGGRWWMKLGGKIRERWLPIYGIEPGVRRCAEEGAGLGGGGRARL